MTVQDAGSTRRKIACLNPAKCGSRWHWSDSNPPCATDFGRVSSRNPLSGLASVPSSRKTPMLSGDGDGIHLNFSDEEWEAFTSTAESIHGLHVNRHALVEVVEKITGGGNVMGSISSDPEQALAYEILCLDKGSRDAVARVAIGEEFSSDEALVEQFSDDLEAILARSHGTDKSNDGGLSLDAFPYTKQRIAGVLDAAFEAQRKKHAFDAMKRDLTKEMYDDHPDRVGQKWTVRGNSVLPFDDKNQRSGDVIVHMGERVGAYDATEAKKVLSQDEWDAALAQMTESDISVSVTDIKKVAKDRGIDVSKFEDEDTTKVRIMVSLPDAADKEMDSTTKAEGIKEWKAGRGTFGSRFYVPDVSDMDEEQAFAALAKARARADRNHSEAHEVAQTLHAGIRGIESVALNQTLRYGDSDRGYTFQVNKTKRFNAEAFDDVYPEIRPGIQKSAYASGTYSPNQKAVEAALGATKSEAEVKNVMSKSRKPSAPTPRFDVVEHSDKGYSKVKPAAEGKARADARISRGEALNGRILTESSFCSNEN